MPFFYFLCKPNAMQQFTDMTNVVSDKPILTITGSDGTGGAGVQADIKMISALGGCTLSAITSVTMQNTLGIQEFYDLPAATVCGQIEAIVNDVQPEIVKIGMLRRVDVVKALSEDLQKYNTREIIFDPVIVSTRGDVLMQPDVVEEIKQRLIPLCSLLSVRKRDADYLLGNSDDAGTDATTLAKELLSLGCSNVLVQDTNTTTKSHTDVFMSREGNDVRYFSSLATAESCGDLHGMGGMLTSAIATFLTKSLSMSDAIAMAYNHINNLSVAHKGLIGRSSELFNSFIDEVAKANTIKLEVSHYADTLNVSSRYLAQVTKRIAGKTPKAIIDEHICREAGRALSTTDMTVQEVAYQLGFGSQAHFTKFFRKTTGVTPTEYRKQQLIKVRE